MSYNDTLNELKAKLTEDHAENEKMLKAEGEKLAKAGDLDGLKAVGELILANMSEDSRSEFNRLTHIDGMALHEVYEQIVNLINENKPVDALPLAERLYKKITVEFAETEKAKFVSLRNPIEDQLCQHLFPTDKTLNRTPYDFCGYITTYGYLLVETGATVDAIPVLEKAITYNPVDVMPRLELAEIYKVIRNRKKLFEVTRDTLRIAYSPIHIGRCYANVAYSLTDTGDYEDAIAFYTASAMFSPNPAIPLEIQHVAQMKGTPLVRPTNDQISAVMKKYDIEFGPNEEVISVSAQLAAHYMGRKDLENALQAMKITYNLTLDENIKKMIIQLDPKAQMAVPKPDESSSGGEGRPNITQTVNDNPEE